MLDDAIIADADADPSCVFLAEHDNLVDRQCKATSETVVRELLAPDSDPELDSVADAGMFSLSVTLGRRKPLKRPISWDPNSTP